MSAFVCSDKHIGGLARFYAEHNGRGAREWDEDFRWAFKTLMDENIRSVCHRYGESPAEHRYTVTQATFDESPEIADPVQILGMVQCLDYQSCETPDWEQSRAWRLLRQIESIAIGKLPGIDKVWAI